MGSVKKAIKIFARLKPTDSSLCKYDIDKHIKDNGTTDDILVLNSTRDNNNNDGDEFNSPYSNSNRPDAYKFRFTKVFDTSSSQDSVFEEMCQPSLESALQGYNSTIFAYGQTGSGKTYTMTGSRQQWKNRGIIPRSLSYIFDKFNALTNRGCNTCAFLSYLEIYNENGYDLLHPGFSSGRIEDLKKVQLLEDAANQIHTKNLTVHPIKSEDEAMQLLYLGDHNRIIAETPMNEASTRSHCIFTIHLRIREAGASSYRTSKLHLVDLAGSERLSNSTSTGQLFHEARHINLALHYLEQVIVALGDSHRTHIPYRNSMMTSILRDSLGGNCMTSMVATLSLENRNLMETLSTCRFSQRVALVENAASLNEETDPMLLIAQLKMENRRLKDIISNSTIRPLESNEPLSQEEVQDCWKLVEKYISDRDDEAILPVVPDMRMVQTCFKCLKMAVSMNKDDLVGIAASVETSPRLQVRLPPHLQLPDCKEFQERSTEKYTQDMTREQLVDCLRVRDAEVDVLTKMLRPNGSGQGNGHNLQQSYQHTRDPGGGPISQSQQHMRMFSDEGEDEDEEDQGNDNRRQSPRSMKQSTSLTDTTGREMPRRGSRGDVSNGSAVNGANDLFDNENVFIEGLGSSKKKALDIFVRSYKGREKLEHGRDNLVSKKNEVESIETQLRRNHANLNNLKVVLMSSDGAGEEEDLFMRDAVEVQSQSIQKQERTLAKSKEEVRRIEENLKALYAQLMNDFESYWISRKEHRPALMGVRGIPSEVDFSLGGATAAYNQAGAATEVSSSSTCSGMDGRIANSQNKQLAEMTKGFVKGVGGDYYYPQRSARSKSTNLMNPSTYTADTQKQYQNSSSKHYPPLPSQPSARACKSLSSSSRKDKASPRGKHPPLNTPRSGCIDNPGGISPKQQFQSGKAPRVPPGTPSVHQSWNNGVSTQQDYDDDDNDDDLIKDLPMTGDETIDQEILSFFRTRQAVFRKINNDKTSRIAEGGGGGILANYQQFS